MTWLRRQLLVLLVLVASLGVTMALWLHEKNNAELDMRTKLDFSVRDVSSRIEQRMAVYEQVLRGAQGLFATSLKVQRKDFSAYISSLQLGADYAGMDGVGLACLVDSTEVAEYVQQEQRQGLIDFHIRPEGVRKQYAPVAQLEPAVGSNLIVVGLDMLADPVHRLAMERARDAGVMSISSKIRLPTESNSGIRSGFLMYLPVYKTPRQNNTSNIVDKADTLEARRANITGWVFAPFRMTDLMASLYGENLPATDIKIYDGVETNDASLIYDSARPSQVDAVLPGHSAQPGRSRFTRQLQATEYVVNGGSSWTIVMSTLPGFEEHVDKDKSAMIIVAGVLLSIVFALLTWQLATGRERALTLAREMTRELRESEARFRYLAQYDELSGLPNRAMFKDRLQQAIVQARRDKTRLALMYLDLDKFKPINDQLGHHVGDLLLQAAALKMLSCVRESDTVARIGGDEFLILLPLIEQDQDALFVAEKIRDAISQPFHLAGGHVLHVSCSIGIATYPEHGEGEMDLSRHADNAMYQAKDCGRDQIKFFGAA
ncbi:MAG: CHASE domain-containing protein [Undibacterium sp.]|uniref:CHASE domain-containing protein n=1 Tax=Undibacterium sp. TaxID=1914977 RepID=UPI00271CE6A2|nr:CHASE domain-containing protein [Undibacterium sp.]MDO8654065.1 CHASE domain-containing protein [Undibacterium sp.]